MQDLIAWFHPIISHSSNMPAGDRCGSNPSSHLSSYPSRFFSIIHLISAPKYNLSPYITQHSQRSGNQVLTLEIQPL